MNALRTPAKFLQFFGLFIALPAWRAESGWWVAIGIMMTLTGLGLGIWFRRCGRASAPSVGTSE